MSEVILEEGSSHLYKWGYTSTGSTGGTIVQSNSNGLPTILLQDDRPLTKCNPKDASGWRRPSSYYRTLASGHCYGPAYTSFARWLSGGGAYWNEETWVGQCFSTWDTSLPSVPSRLKAVAESRALAKVLNQDVDFGVQIATAGETAAMLATTLKRIVSGVRAAKQLNPHGVVNALRPFFRGDASEKVGRLVHKRWKKPAELWLEAQYGWKPALQDAYGAIHAYEKRADVGPPRIDVKGKAYEYIEDLVDAQTAGGGTGAVGGYALWKVKEARTRLFGYTVHLTYEMTNAALHKAAQLGVINPLIPLWEVTPFSFMVDWWLPVGTWLQSLSATAGMSFKAGTYTSIAIRKGEWILVPYNSRAEGASLYLYGDKYRRFGMNRQVYESEPSFKPWDLVNPWGLHGKRIANAAALVATNTSRLKKLARALGG